VGRPSPPPGDDALAATTVHSGGTVPALVAGRYRPERLLGRGGAKEVWLAHDLTLEREVAISRALAGARGEPARQRMRREARLMARLGDHPHVVTVFDAFDDGGELHIVARYMEGGSLAARLAASPSGRLEIDEVVRAGRTVADALAHAHVHGVVHRDVKPDNVWLTADGVAVLGDFGIAVTHADAAAATAAAGPATGTPYYQPPEQADGAPPTPQADLYALGAALWELLCGCSPSTGRRPPSRRRRWCPASRPSSTA
jgi:serine/threonine protein kinase